jgi:predicted transcriptional regulator
MNHRTLHVKVGEPPKAVLKRAASTMKALDRGETPEPYFSVGFADVGQLFSVFTPRRWELLTVLRQSGPLPIAQLARLLGRDYKNVYGDIEKLIEWQVVEKNARRQVFTPYSKISIDVSLPDQQAA